MQISTSQWGGKIQAYQNIIKGCRQKFKRNYPDGRSPCVDIFPEALSSSAILLSRPIRRGSLEEIYYIAPSAGLECKKQLVGFKRNLSQVILFKGD